MRDNRYKKIGNTYKAGSKDKDKSEINTNIKNKWKMGKYSIYGNFRHQNGLDIGDFKNKSKEDFDEILGYLSRIGGNFQVTANIEYYD